MDAVETGVSSRNSEVIHAGIYYATGLAKTRLCVEGKVMLYRFCREYGVQHRRSGKLIVAADESEISKLAALEAQAKANGVNDLLWLSGAEVRALEPALRANRALLSPSTGIVDSHALMLALKGDAEAHGAMIALATPVLSGRAHGDGDRNWRRGADAVHGDSCRQCGGPGCASGRSRHRRPAA
jgi:L-2-hydroxyglutarate oxidase LhgO